MRMLV